MRRFIDWLESWMPYLWSLLWVTVITLFSAGAVIWCFKWIINLVGVN